MFKIYPLNTFTQVAIVPTNNQGYTGFTGKPIIYLPPNEEWIIEAENHIRPSKHNHDGYSGKGYIETSTSLNSNITFEVEVPTSGTYYIDIRYANGNGPINTENKCAIRTLFTNGRPHWGPLSCHKEEKTNGQIGDIQIQLCLCYMRVKYNINNIYKTSGRKHEW